MSEVKYLRRNKIWMRKLLEATKMRITLQKTTGKDKMSSGGQIRRNKNDRFILKNDDAHKINGYPVKYMSICRKNIYIIGCFNHRTM